MPRIWPPILAGLAGLATGGCEGTVINAAARLGLSPAELAFGAVPTGETRGLIVTLSNTAAAAGTLTISSVALAEASAPAYAVEAPATPLTLGPGQSAAVVVRYTADDGEPDAGALEIVSNALGGGLARVPLGSARTYPRIEVSPPVLELGSLTAGTRATRTLRVRSTGDAALHVGRASIRTDGFAGEVCAADEDCHEELCLASRTGPICAAACGAGGRCPDGYVCATDAGGGGRCLEGEGAAPPLAARGFSVAGPGLASLPNLLPGAWAELELTYAPSASDRGSAQLVLESDDVERPMVVVPLLGRPNDLPPVAVAAFDGPPPSRAVPGTRVALTSAGSYDPEGGALAYAWRFAVRPEGSRASFEDATAATTAFTVDLPGSYVVRLEARDPGGLASTNDARVELGAAAGSRVRAVLAWDRPETDLDLHLVAPGAALGSLGDCFFDNPTPDFPPAGPDADPALTLADRGETIALPGPSDGVYTLVVRVVTGSPSGATTATLRLLLDDVEAFVAVQTLPASAEQWDIATLTWPSGQLTPLGTVR